MRNNQVPSTKDKILRALLHVPVGIFNVACLQVHWVIALIFFGGFMVYEVTEDWRLKDRAYIDIFGYLIGVGVGVAVYVFLDWRGIL